MLFKNFYHRIEELYWTIVPYEYRPLQLWYKLKCRLFKRYNTVRCRYLSYTWVDRDILLAHVMFEVFSQFIEKEYPYVEFLPEYKDDKQRLIELYNWWHQVYNKKRIEELHNMENILYNLTPENAFDEGGNLSLNYEKELHDKLVQLISLRRYMWS